MKITFSCLLLVTFVQAAENKNNALPSLFLNSLKFVKTGFQSGIQRLLKIPDYTDSSNKKSSSIPDSISITESSSSSLSSTKSTSPYSPPSPTSTLNLLPTITSQFQPRSDDTLSPSDTAIDNLILRAALPTSAILLILCALMAFKLRQLQRLKVENHGTNQFEEGQSQSCHGLSVNHGKYQDYIDDFGSSSRGSSVNKSCESNSCKDSITVREHNFEDNDYNHYKSNAPYCRDVIQRAADRRLAASERNTENYSITTYSHYIDILGNPEDARNKYTSSGTTLKAFR
jgi:hypothetical protein